MGVGRTADESALKEQGSGSDEQPFRRTWFRAGHAHAGVMLLMALLFFDYLAQTKLSLAAKHVACGIFVAGILTQSGGFFIHMTKGEEDSPSIGTTITSLGAVLLTAANCDTGLRLVLRSHLKGASPAYHAFRVKAHSGFCTRPTVSSPALARPARRPLRPSAES